MHHALKRGTKKSITLAKLVKFLVISIFHETKIRMVDMKVQVYSKFRKNKISKKVKSPNSMRNGRFNTSKCRGKLEKMGVLCTHSPKSPGPIFKLPIKDLNKNKKDLKKMDQANSIQVSTHGRRATTGRHMDRVGLSIFFGIFFLLLCSTFCASGQLLLVGFNTCPPCLEFT
jgi:hypothetical protein